MRELSITNQSWSVDDDDNIIGDNGRADVADAVQAASVSYGYARL